jgi:hypothetical protein
MVSDVAVLQEQVVRLKQQSARSCFYTGFNIQLRPLATQQATILAVVLQTIGFPDVFKCILSVLSLVDHKVARKCLNKCRRQKLLHVNHQSHRKADVFILTVAA